LIAINCGAIQVLNSIVVEVGHWNWLLIKLNELMLRQNVINKQPLKTFMSTTKFGYVPACRKKIFQNCRCRNVSSHWMMGTF